MSLSGCTTVGSVSDFCCRQVFSMVKVANCPVKKED